MADTGCNARRMFGVIESKLCQRLHWRRTSPVTSNDSRSSFFFPITPLFAQFERRRAAGLCAVVHGNCRAQFMSAGFFDAVPWRQRLCGGCWGRKNGSSGRLLPARRGGPCPPPAAPRQVRSFFKILISRVTTPIPMGAFFRNEGGRNTPSLPRMEEGTQGVSPSFKEEVALGVGVVPFACMRRGGGVSPDRFAGAGCLSGRR